MGEPAINPYEAPKAPHESPAPVASGGRIRATVLAISAAAFAVLRLRSWLQIESADLSGAWSSYLLLAGHISRTAALLAGGAAVLLFLRRGVGLVVFASTVAAYAVWRIPASLSLRFHHVQQLPVWYLCLRALWPFLFMSLALGPSVRQQFGRQSSSHPAVRAVSVLAWALVAVGLASLWPIAAGWLRG